MKLLLKVVITLTLLGVIIWKLGGLGEVGALMARMDPVFVVLVLGVNTLDRALMTFKWTWLLQGRGLRLPFMRGMMIYCASMIWGLFLPATVGADVIRGVSTSRTGLDSNEVAASIIIERMVGFLCGLLLGLLSLVLLSLLDILDSRFTFVWWAGGAMLLGATVTFMASFNDRIFDTLHSRFLGRFRRSTIVRRLREFHSTYRAYQDDKLKLVAFFGMTFFEQLMSIVLAWLIAVGMGIEVGLLYVAGAVPLAMLISRIPISLNGWGVYDGIFMVLMSLAGVSASEAIAIIVVSRVIQIAAWLPWWGAFVIGIGSLRPPRLVVQDS